MAACNRFGDGLFRCFDCKRYYFKTYPLETDAGHGFRLRIFSGSHAFHRLDVCKTFSHLIESVDHWIAFAILAFLGGRMIFESFKEEECCKLFNPAKLKVVFTMAIATSIDALAIGISFAFLGVQDYTQILSPISIIGLVSFVMSLIGLIFGIQCGCGIARKVKAELWGGIILVIIGLKILVEHLFFQ